MIQRPFLSLFPAYLSTRFTSIFEQIFHKCPQAISPIKYVTFFSGESFCVDTSCFDVYWTMFDSYKFEPQTEYDE